jgi:hypothetical protein
MDTRQLFIRSNSPGLSTDCPEEEKVRWAEAFPRVQKALNKLLKQPRRSVMRAAADMRSLGRLEEDRVKQLNHFQLEDIQTFVDQAERRLVQISLDNLIDMEEYAKLMAQEDRDIKTAIRGRMTKKRTIALGATMLGLFFMGLLPALVQNTGNIQSRSIAALLILVAMGTMALASIGVLLYLRYNLVFRLKKFNAVMKSILIDVQNLLVRSSDYLSCACNILRGNGVLNDYQTSVAPDTKQVRIMRKHIMDLNCCREELHESFEIFFAECEDKPYHVEQDTVYEYDFSSLRKYSYPIPYTEDMRRNITFLQDGYTTQVPVNFIKRISLRREELYD